MGRLQQVTAVVGIGVIHMRTRSVQQPESAYPYPDNLNRKTDTGREKEVQRKANRHQHRRYKEHEVIPLITRTRERPQVHIIKRIDAEVRQLIGVSAYARLYIREEEPMVDVQYGGSEIEKENRVFDTRFIVRPKCPHQKEDEPKKAHHHRQRYDPLVQHLFHFRLQNYCFFLIYASFICICAIFVVPLQQILNVIL